MRKLAVIVSIISLLTYGLAQAEKPANKGEMPQKQEQMMQKEMHGKEQGEHTASGMEKQEEMKSQQMNKELDKGSEQGQSARDEHSRKWWKFWE